jgi:hypothetical protein
LSVTYGRLEVFSENSWFPPPTKPLYFLIIVESGFKNNSNPDKYFMIYSLILLFYLYYEMKTSRLMVNNSTERQLYWLSFFDLRLLITHLMFNHFIGCLSSTYGFWLPIWCLIILLVVFLRLTASYYPFDVLPFYWLSFELRLLITHLMFNHFIGCPSTYCLWLPIWCLTILLVVLRFTASDYPFDV